MDDIQIVVLHSRGVYNFMGINLVAKLCFIFFIEGMVLLGLILCQKKNEENTHWLALHSFSTCLKDIV